MVFFRVSIRSSSSAASACHESFDTLPCTRGHAKKPCSFCCISVHLLLFCVSISCLISRAKSIKCSTNWNRSLTRPQAATSRTRARLCSKVCSWKAGATAFAMMRSKRPRLRALKLKEEEVSAACSSANSCTGAFAVRQVPSWSSTAPLGHLFTSGFSPNHVTTYFQPPTLPNSARHSDALLEPATSPALILRDATWAKCLMKTRRIGQPLRSQPLTTILT
mmetsp:Transcript_124785/g.296103  ORF Transcript_124785/g.296103 Transcript_124785/m.296103 type:complete len:221 (+) Transcript_124785:2767-3429(+)